jgi:hypothetical protein
VAIRKDLPMPTVHARNLFHTSAAMYDAWASYDATADGVFFTEKHSASDVEAARREAITYAAYKVLAHRDLNAAGGDPVLACLAEEVRRLGYKPEDNTTSGDTARAVGNRVAQVIITATVDDGANEANAYADTTGWQPDNSPLAFAQPGAFPEDPNHWQQLQFGTSAFTQNGIKQDAGIQPYVGAHWRNVTPFAMTRASSTALYHEPGTAPSVTMPEMKGWVVDVLQKQAWLEVTDDQMDISPASLGQNSLGANDGHGWAQNPVTGQAYAPQLVRRADFGRVLAEFWADGPRSETPPGHWNVIANQVSYDSRFTRQWHGQGPTLGALEFDVKLYLSLNGALHDAAITAWEIKRVTTTARPITLVRWLALKGQSSDAGAPGYDVGALPEVPGLLEMTDETSTQPGGRHAGLDAGVMAVRSWQGEGVGGVAWRGADAWMPYQKKTFVTPAFPGFISGHSTFSRSGAEVLTTVTGSPYFPGGLGGYTIKANTGLTFEAGPSTDVTLQWASYADAADQAGQSRLWGGIHIQPDDFVGRKLGHDVGLAAAAKAQTYFDGTAR